MRSTISELVCRHCGGSRGKSGHGFARLSFRRHGRKLAAQGRESFHALVSTEARCVNSPAGATPGSASKRVWLLLYCRLSAASSLSGV